MERDIPYVSKISIHALRKERDAYRIKTDDLISDFNPRAPQGARLHIVVQKQKMRYFNPRAPQGARLMF